MKYLSVILLIALSYSSVNGSTFLQCDPISVEWHPHPESCELFILCFWGETLVRSCAPGLHFNRNTTQCMIPELAGCNIGSVVYCATPDDPFALDFKAHPVDCSKYYLCFNGDPIARECAPNFWWDINNEWCTFPHLVNCDSRTQNNPNDPNFTTNDPTDYATTPSTTTEVLTQPHPTTTTIRTTSYNPNTYDCPLSSQVSFHPHTISCWRYFVCINGSITLINNFNHFFDNFNSFFNRNCKFERLCIIIVFRYNHKKLHTTQ